MYDKQNLQYVAEVANNEGMRIDKLWYRIQIECMKEAFEGGYTKSIKLYSSDICMDYFPIIVKRLESEGFEWDITIHMDGERPCISLLIDWA